MAVERLRARARGRELSKLNGILSCVLCVAFVGLGIWCNYQLTHAPSGDDLAQAQQQWNSFVRTYYSLGEAFGWMGGMGLVMSIIATAGGFGRPKKGEKKQ